MNCIDINQKIILFVSPGSGSGSYRKTKVPGIYYTFVCVPVHGWVKISLAQ